MKKQFLLLTFFTLALIFAGIKSSNAQYKNADPKMWVAPTCTGSALTPAVGVLYPYEVAIGVGSGFDGVGGTFTWKVTQNVDLMAASTVPAADFTGTAGATPNIYNITWNPSSVGKTYYLVVEYTEPNANVTAACDPNNMKVYEIKPINTFWLDIDASTVAFAIADEATTTIFDVCPPPVSSAVITPGTPTVEYQFGVTNLYAVIHAAGYTGDFSATLTIAGLKANQSLTVPTGWTASGTPDAQGNGTYTATLASTNAGIDHNVTLAITNNQFEGLADLPVTITIDGTYTDGTNTYKDKYDGATNCIDQPDDGDYVIETVRARPTVTPKDPAPFVTPAPALNN